MMTQRFNNDNRIRRREYILQCGYLSDGYISKSISKSFNISNTFN
jgi:hypothetical protein